MVDFSALDTTVTTTQGPHCFVVLHGSGKIHGIHEPFRGPMLDALTRVSDFDTLYLLPVEVNRTIRRTREWTFQCKTKPLTWNKYFAFERFGLTRRLLPLMARPFDMAWLHRSPLNPHLFLELRRQS